MKWKFVPYIVIVFCALLYFFEVIFQSKLFIHTGMILSDLFLFNFPVKNLLYNSLVNNHRIPFWTDLIGNGYPIFAEGQMGALNPVNLIFLSLPLPFYLLFNFLTVFYVIIGGFSMYILLKKSLHLHETAAFFGSILFMFSGYMLANLHHINVIQVLYLFPILIYVTERVLSLDKETSSYLKSILMLVFIFFLQISAGHIESTYYSLLFMSVYILIRLFVEHSIRRFWIMKISVFIIAGVLAFLLMSIQLLSTFELVANSVRQEGVTYDYSTSQPWPVETLAILVNPWKYPLYIDGMPYQIKPDVFTHLNWLYIYIGIIPLITALFAIGLLFWKRSEIKLKYTRWVITYLALLLLSYLYAIGTSTEIFSIFWKLLPGITMFRYQTKAVYFFEFSLVVLSAIGFDAVICLLQSKYKLKPNLTILLATLLIAIAFVDLYLNNKRIQPIAQADDWLKEPPMATAIHQQECSAIVSICEKTYASRTYSRGSDVIHNSKVFDYGLQKDLRNNLYIDYNMLYSIPLNSAYSGLPLREHEVENSYDTALNPASGNMVIPQNTQKMLALQSVQFLITHNPIENPDYLLMKQFKLQSAYPQRLPLKDSKEVQPFVSDMLYLYEQPYFVPRFSLIPQSNAVIISKDSIHNKKLAALDSVYNAGINEHDQNSLHILLSDEFDAKKQVLIEGTKEKTPTTLTETNSAYTLLSYTPERIEMKLKNTEPDYFVTTDSFYPGWHALVDQKEIPVVRSNFISRAVAVPKGEHTLILYFEPTFLKIGTCLTLIGISLITGIVGYLLFIWKKNYTYNN